MNQYLSRYSVGFTISHWHSREQLTEIALELWGADDSIPHTQRGRHLSWSIGTDKMVWIAADTDKQAAQILYFATSIGTHYCVYDHIDACNRLCAEFYPLFSELPALTYLHNIPITIKRLIDLDILIQSAPWTIRQFADTGAAREWIAKLEALPRRPGPKDFIFPPPRGTFHISRRTPNPDIVVQFFQVGFTVDRNPSDELLGRAVADLFAQHPTAWHYHLAAFRRARHADKSELVWISAASREQVGHVLYWGLSLGNGIAVIDAHAAAAIPAESFLFEATVPIARTATADDGRPITAELLRACDINSATAAPSSRQS